jgi:RNA polymerase sigma-70 factor (ECF subfamily)
LNSPTLPLRLAFSRLLPLADAGKRTPDSSSLEAEVVVLFDNLRVPLLRYLSCCRVPMPDAEEIVQEVFLLLFQRLQRGPLNSEPPAWAFRTARNYVLKHRDRSRRESESVGSSAQSIEAVADSAHPADLSLEHAEHRDKLLAVVAALPEQDQQCLHLRAEGLRYREISGVLGISLGTVANSLRKSLARLARVDSKDSK